MQEEESIKLARHGASERSNVGLARGLNYVMRLRSQHGWTQGQEMPFSHPRVTPSYPVPRRENKLSSLEVQPQVLLHTLRSPDRAGNGPCTSLRGLAGESCLLIRAGLRLSSRELGARGGGGTRGLSSHASVMDGEYGRSASL